MTKRDLKTQREDTGDKKPRKSSQKKERSSSDSDHLQKKRERKPQSRKQQKDLDSDDNDDVFITPKRRGSQKKEEDTDSDAEQRSEKKEPKKPQKKSSHKKDDDSSDSDSQERKETKQRKSSQKKDTEKDSDDDRSQKKKEKKSSSKKEDTSDSETDKTPTHKDKEKQRKSSQKKSDSTDESDQKEEKKKKKKKEKKEKKGQSKQRRKPSSILKKFDGESSVEIFLEQFKQIAKFEDWDEEETIHFLGQSMTGKAEDFAVELGKCTILEEAYKLVEKTYANRELTKKYRAELKNRRLRPGETLSDLCHAIKKLMKLAYPAGLDPTMYEEFSRDAFINSITDSDIRKRLKELQCENLQKAFILASSLMADAEEESMRDDSKLHSSKVRLVEERGREGTQEDKQPPNLMQDYAKVMELIFDKNAEKTRQENKKRDEEMKKREDQMMKQFKEMTPAYKENKPGERTAEADESFNRGRGRGRGRGGHYRPDGTRVCYNCQATDGHIARDCTAPKKDRYARKAEPAAEEAKVNEIQVQVNKLVTVPVFENYLEIQTSNGKTITALVDTGCQFTCGPSKYFAQADLSPCETVLCTAGGKQLKVKGCTMMTFTVSDLTITTEVIVSDELDELLIGANTINENNAVWDFTAKTLTINKVPILLKARQCKCNVRRVYIRETTVVPANCLVMCKCL